MNKNRIIFFLFLILTSFCEYAEAASFPYNLAIDPKERTDELTVIGSLQSHDIADKETLLDVARDYGLGYNEIALYYPGLYSGQKPHILGILYSLGLELKVCHWALSFCASPS